MLVVEARDIFSDDWCDWCEVSLAGVISPIVLVVISLRLLVICSLCFALDLTDLASTRELLLLADSLLDLAGLDFAFWSSITTFGFATMTW